MWKLHEIRDEGVYNDLRYDRIRYLEETKRKGEPALTLYPDPGDKHADIGIGFRLESNWDEILEGLGFDIKTTAPQAEKDLIQYIKDLVNGTWTTETIEILQNILDDLMAERLLETGVGREIFGFYN